MDFESNIDHPVSDVSGPLPFSGHNENRKDTLSGAKRCLSSKERPRARAQRRRQVKATGMTGTQIRSYLPRQGSTSPQGVAAVEPTAYPEQGFGSRRMRRFVQRNILFWGFQSVDLVSLYCTAKQVLSSCADRSIVATLGRHRFDGHLTRGDPRAEHHAIARHEPLPAEQETCEFQAGVDAVDPCYVVAGGSIRRNVGYDASE